MQFLQSKCYVRRWHLRLKDADYRRLSPIVATVAKCHRHSYDLIGTSLYRAVCSGNELQVRMGICNSGGSGNEQGVELFSQDIIFSICQLITPYNSVGNALFEYRDASCLGRKR